MLVMLVTQKLVFLMVSYLNVRKLLNINDKVTCNEVHMNLHGQYIKFLHLYNVNYKYIPCKGFRYWKAIL